VYLLLVYFLSSTIHICIFNIILVYTYSQQYLYSILMIKIIIVNYRYLKMTTAITYIVITD
jgi:hypothetical protein